MAVLPTGIGPVTGYNIERSLRFNSADSAYLNRTPASASNRRTFTWSGWVKRSKLGISAQLFSTPYASAGANSTYLAFGSTDGISFSSVQSTNQFSLATSQVFRDVSAWYHIVAVCDTTNATSSDRVRLYINGERVTAFGVATYPSQNYESYVNSTVVHNIGRLNLDGGTSQLFDGYMTEINFIDGQALTPSSFGETDSNTGVWKPKAYTGTYGTNGFFLKFADNSNTTAATLGKDSSGNGNNWTPNNFSVTAGAGNDSLVDTPTNYGTDTGVGGEVRGNYATLNPLDVSANTLSNGNLDITYATNSDTNRGGTIAVSTGKWYFEATVQAVGGIYAIIGVTSGVATATALGTSAYQYSYISSTGNKFNNNSSTAYGNTYTTGDVIGVALDMDNGKVWFSKNGTFQASGDPAAGTNQAFSGLSGSFSPAINARNNSIVNLNCGQRAFAYTAPSGFKALCTQNLPTPTIGATSTTQANDYFNVVTFNGNGGSNVITGVGFQPDFVWVKSRSNAYSHNLHDVLRGPSSYLVSNSTAAENTSYTNICQFTSDGFTLSADNSANVAGTTNVGWAWDAGGTGVTNTAGSITSTVSASTTSGFSIVTYTGNGTAGATVGHGLGVAPSFIIVKNRDSAVNWNCYHISLGATKIIELNSTNAATTTSTRWNDTTPSSTLVTLGSSSAVNTNAVKYVMYAFAPVAGYSAFGSYTGNGSTDGPFVYTGFRPRYFMAKRTDAAGNSWILLDTARNTYNAVDAFLSADLSNAEATSYPVDFLSNGFKIRATTSNLNASSGTYIYMAFAESPFKYSLAR